MCSDLHAEVRHTAGHKGVGVDVFMTGQERKEEERTAFLYGVLHTVHTRTVRIIPNQNVAPFTALVLLNYISHSVWAECLCSYIHV